MKPHLSGFSQYESLSMCLSQLYNSDMLRYIAEMHINSYNLHTFKGENHIRKLAMTKAGHQRSSISLDIPKLLLKALL